MANFDTRICTWCTCATCTTPMTGRYQQRDYHTAYREMAWMQADEKTRARYLELDYINAKEEDRERAMHIARMQRNENFVVIEDEIIDMSKFIA